jgi:hypothetical protein
MKRLAIVTSVVLAMTGAVAGQPGVYGGDQPSHGRRYEDRWVPLVNRISLTSARMYVPLGGEFGPMRRLRIERMSGRPYVRGVTIEFMDGTVQSVPIERELVEGSGVIYVDLTGGVRVLSRLVVDVRPDYRSTLSIVGI